MTAALFVVFPGVVLSSVVASGAAVGVTVAGETGVEGGSVVVEELVLVDPGVDSSEWTTEAAAKTTARSRTAFMVTGKSL